MDLFHLGTWLVSSGEWETFCKVVMGLYQCLFQSITFDTIDLYYYPFILICSGTYKSGTGRPIPSYLGIYLQKQTRIIRPPKTVIQNCSILHFVFLETLQNQHWIRKTNICFLCQRHVWEKAYHVLYSSILCLGCWGSFLVCEVNYVNLFQIRIQQSTDGSSLAWPSSLEAHSSTRVSWD
jgi:hypothetical protein